MSKASPIGPFIVNLPVTERERDLLNEAAKRSGLSMRQWMRQVLVAAATDKVCGDIDVGAVR